jgi:uncharacterized membrane protein
MEALIVLFVLGLVAVLAVAPILAIVALVRVGRVSRELAETQRSLAFLERMVRSRGAAAAPQPGEAAPVPTPQPAAVPTPAAAPEPVERVTAPAPAEPARAAGKPAAAEAPPAEPPPAEAADTAGAPEAARTEPLPPLRPSRPEAPPLRLARTSPPPSLDFASDLGPKLLVAAGGLAVVVFLGFFVRYAWENDWVGPTGRVLSGAVFSLGLVAAGLRLMHREYRPLGQGLAAAGLSGLYITAFAAHSVYDLLPRSAAAVFMVVVTACAVALADRLDARLLATLAWVGGYLTPVVLSTGEDRAESLLVYLLLLGSGAVWLDRRKTWAETLPLSLLGSAVLSTGWCAQHFRPERFWVAAVGLVLLTALFALGSAAKERKVSMGLVAILAVFGLSALATGADRPEVVMVLCVLLAAALLRFSNLGLVGAVLLAPFVLAVPFVFWAGSHYRPEAFGVAAAWVMAGSLVLALLARGEDDEPSAAVAPAIALLGGGTASIGLAAASNRPLALLALLLAQAGLAVLVRRRWGWSEAAGSALAGLAVWAWFARYFEREQASEALVLACTVAGVYFLVASTRGLARHEPLSLAGAATHVLAAALAWGALYHVLDLTAPSLPGFAAVLLGAIHLAVGLAARSRGDGLATRVTLGLAAGFLTIAIPVQLGLHGITLAWAIEGLVLLWLGSRESSWLARGFGYGVLVLAVGRLFVRHLPLHGDAFVPVVNPAFGAWLAVIVSLAVAWALSRRQGSFRHTIDQAASLLLLPTAIVLLFALLTMETQSAFAQRAREAVAANDAAAARAAALQGDLAVSVLWTLFATGLLAAGLGMRSRGLFYAAYALFAITAGKVVLVALATLPTLYRMLSFLALGVLLLAGAWLNLRFRERLAAPEEAAP